MPSSASRKLSTPRLKPPKKRLWLFRLVLLSGSLLITVLLAEVTVRLRGVTPLQVDPDGTKKLKSLHREVADGGPLVYELAPLAETGFALLGPAVKYRVNEDGLRADRRYPRPKPKGVQRVVMLGDSVLFGLGVPVEETFAARLEQALGGVEVVNGGVGGYSTFSELVWFQTIGVTYEPDLVVLCYCPNDVADPLDLFVHTAGARQSFPKAAIPNATYHARRITEMQAKRPRPERSRSILKSVANWTRRRSALMNLCLTPFSHSRRNRAYQRSLEEAADVHSDEYGWLERQMEGIAATAKSLKVPVLFTYLPLRYELDPDDPAHGELGRRVCELAEACGFKVVDVAKALAPLNNSHIDASHLSSEGHAAVAEELANVVSRLGFGSRP